MKLGRCGPYGFLTVAAGSQSMFYAPYVRQSPVSPSQQPTLNRQRGHWNVPWRHSIGAEQRGQDSTADSAGGPWVDGVAMPTP